MLHKNRQTDDGWKVASYDKALQKDADKTHARTPTINYDDSWWPLTRQKCQNDILLQIMIFKALSWVMFFLFRLAFLFFLFSQDRTISAYLVCLFCSFKWSSPFQGSTPVLPPCTWFLNHANSWQAYCPFKSIFNNDQKKVWNLRGATRLKWKNGAKLMM